MTVKVMLLKSGEDVISDAKEIMDTEKKGIVAYHLSNPFVMQLTAEPSDELQVEGEDAPRTKYSVKYSTPRILKMSCGAGLPSNKYSPFFIFSP